MASIEYSSIILSGGHIKSASFIGCIKCLEEKGMIKHLRQFVGTSAGAVICYLLALGFSSKDIRDFLINVLHDDKLNNFNIEEICNLFENLGIDSGEKLETIFKKALKLKLDINNDDIDFITFAKVTGKDLVICVSNLTKEKEEFFSVDSTPNMSVVTALRASCSLPIIFTPVVINDMMYIDGGAYCNLPLNYIKDVKSRNDVIALNIKQTNYNNTSDFLNYMRFIIYSILEKKCSYENNDDQNVLSLFFDEADDLIFSFSDLKLDVKVETVDKLIKKGYEAMKVYLKKCTTFSEKIDLKSI